MQTKIDKNLPLFKELKVNTEKLRVDLDDLTEKVNKDSNTLKNNYYTKDEIDTKIGDIESILATVVEV